MKMTKKIDRLLKRRTRLAGELSKVSSEIDDWLESRGLDLNSPKLSDAVCSGCMIYTEPEAAERTIREVIESC